LLLPPLPIPCIVHWTGALGDREAWGSLHEAGDRIVVRLACTPPPTGAALTIEIHHETGLFLLPGVVSSHQPGEIVLTPSGPIERIQRREFVREPVDRDTMSAYRIGLDGEPAERFAVRLIDLSGGGIRFECLEPLVTDDLIGVNLRLDDGEPVRPIVRILAARVREVIEPSGERYLTRIARGPFVAITEKERKRIVQFVFKLEARRHRPPH
jgi:hypothetical protein